MPLSTVLFPIIFIGMSLTSTMFTSGASAFTLYNLKVDYANGTSATGSFKIDDANPDIVNTPTGYFAYTQKLWYGQDVMISYLGNLFSSATGSAKLRQTSLDFPIGGYYYPFFGERNDALDFSLLSKGNLDGYGGVQDSSGYYCRFCKENTRLDGYGAFQDSSGGQYVGRYLFGGMSTENGLIPITNISVTQAVPEPSSILGLLTVSISGVWLKRRNRNKS